MLDQPAQFKVSPRGSSINAARNEADEEQILHYIYQCFVRLKTRSKSQVSLSIIVEPLLRGHPGERLSPLERPLVNVNQNIQENATAQWQKATVNAANATAVVNITDSLSSTSNMYKISLKSCSNVSKSLFYHSFAFSTNQKPP